MFLYQILVCTTHGKHKESHAKTINVKYQLEQGMKNLIYLIHLINQIFKIILNIP